MFGNKRSIYLLKRDLIRCAAVILCFVAAITPIYFKCSEVLYDSLRDKLTRNIDFGGEIIKKELDAQNIMIEKLKASHLYNSLRKRNSGLFRPEENVTLNEMQRQYNDLCGAFFVRENTLMFFHNNDVMIEKNSITPYAMNVYGYSFKFKDMDYSHFRQKLFSREYFGEFPSDIKLADSKKTKLIYMKTVGSFKSSENSVMLSIFDFNEIIRQCGLEEIAKNGNIYIRNWDGEKLASSVKTSGAAMRITRRFSSVPLTVTAEVSKDYAAGQMRTVRRVIVFYFAAATAVMIFIVLLYAYKHWKMVSEIAEVFGKDEGFDEKSLNIDYKYIKERRGTIDGQRKKIDELMTEKLFSELINNGVSDEELSVLQENMLGETTSFCLMMIKTDEADETDPTYVISRFYESHMNIILRSKTDSDLIVLLLDAQSLNVAELKKLTRDIIYNDNLKIRVVISSVQKSLGDIPNVCRQLRNVLLYLENSSFVQLDDIKRDEAYDSFISFEYTKQLYEHIMNGNMRLAVRQVYEQWYYLAENPSVTDEISKLFYWQYGVIAQAAAELGYKGKLPVLSYGDNVVDIAREVISVVEKLAAISGAKRSVEPDRSEQIIKYIDENCYDSQFYMQNLCDEFALSERTIGDIIKNKTGMRFSDYIGALRMKQVEKLLSTTDISINDIAAMCGFASNNALYKAFKRVHSMSPSQYREDTNDASLKTEDKE